MERRAGRRMAVLVGCNYPNTENELHGCINDVHTMKKLIIERFGFIPNHIEVLTDEARSHSKPIGANIRRALNRMVDNAGQGDVLLFFFSGHGTKIPSTLGPELEEAIVPCDLNLITKVDFRRLVNRLPREASFTFISDSCHSGGLIDQEKEQIGPSRPSRHGVLRRHHPVITRKFIPYESILEQLSSLTNIATGDIGTHLSAYFGEDVSPMFMLSHSVLNLHLYENLHRPDSGILLSGCQSDEMSADIRTGEGKAYGAFSNAVQKVLRGAAPHSNRKVVLLARKMVEELGVGVHQHPCLYCSDENADADFLRQPTRREWT